MRSEEWARDVSSKMSKAFPYLDCQTIACMETLFAETARTYARECVEAERLTKENQELMGRPSPYSKQWADLSLMEGVRIIQEQILDWFRGAHYVNVAIRRNAQDEVHEADWLKYVPSFVERVARERDEALAQVAVLKHGIEQQAGIAVHLSQQGCACCEQWRAALRDQPIPAEARALLDRLQQAEAVVEALSFFKGPCDNPLTTIPNLQTGRAVRKDCGYCRTCRANKALAEWEEGKI